MSRLNPLVISEQPWTTRWCCGSTFSDCLHLPEGFWTTSSGEQWDRFTSRLRPELLLLPCPQERLNATDIRSTLKRFRRQFLSAESHWPTQIQIQRTGTQTRSSSALTHCCILCLFTFVDREHWANRVVKTKRTRTGAGLHSYDSADQRGSAFRRHQCFHSQTENRKLPSASSAPRGFCVFKPANQREALLSTCS